MLSLAGWRMRVFPMWGVACKDQPREFGTKYPSNKFGNPYQKTRG